MATNKKRSRPQGAEDRSSKHVRLNYSRTITIKVDRQIRPIELKSHSQEDRTRFTVYEDLLVQNSSYFREQIAQNPSKTKFDLDNIDPEEFKTYLDWIQKGRLDIEMVESANARMLRKLSKSPRVRAKRDGAILFRLCRLLIMDDTHMQDDNFSNALVALLGALLEKHAASAVCLTASQGQQIWHMVRQLFPEHQHQMPKWMAADLSATSLEESRHLLAPPLFEAIKKMLPEELEVLVGKDQRKRTFMVDERRCRGHSKVLERSLASGRTRKPGLVLPAEDPKCFALYLRCLAVDRPDFLSAMDTLTKCENGKFVPVNEADSRDAMHKLCELWILASHLEDLRMQNAIMDAINALRLAISLRTAEMVIGKTAVGSGLRRWIADLLAEAMTTDWLTQWSREVSKELLIDWVHASVQSREEKAKAGTTIAARRPDHYHTH